MRDFFRHQDVAFAKTFKLATVLAVAIAGTILVTGLAVTYVFALAAVLTGLHPSLLVASEVMFAMTVVTAVVVASFCWWKTRQLRSGGRVIAEGLGGHLLAEPTTCPDEKRVLNVVQEMAVAAGIPAPAVYVIEQSSINAFAAGFDFDDAVVGVTRGCLQRLNRDQLQGVMAHEFSHILNGDMQINLRLVGVLHGILSITIIAEWMFAIAYEIHTTASDPDSDMGHYVLAVGLVVLGAFLWPIGMVGTFFGILVMCATSRTREFLADAFAVQFTRNPHGIAEALKVIAGHQAGSLVRSRNALETSHFFFAQGAGWFSSGWLASHPPIGERIRRLDPEWNGVPLFESDHEIGEYDGAYQAAHRLLQKAPGVSALAGEMDGVPADVDDPDDDRLGLHDGSDRYADQVLAELPDAWVDLAQDPHGGAAMISALWITRTSDGAAEPLLMDSVSKAATELRTHLTALGDAHRLMLFDFALDAIQQLPSRERRELIESLTAIRRLVPVDDVCHWSWNKQLLHHRESATDQSPRYGRLAEVENACEVLLSWFAHVGADSQAMAEYGFQRAIVHTHLPAPELRDEDDLTLEQLDTALEILAETSARCRRQLKIAIGTCVAADQVVGLRETSLVRGTFASLALEVPRLLPGQAVTPGA